MSSYGDNNRQVLALSGTAALPGHSFLNATKNGMYLPTTNSLGLSTNGTNAVYIDASQNVGIGTSSPVTKLQVSSSTTANDDYGFIQANYTGTTTTVNAGITVKNYQGTSQFMQWDVIGLRIGSRIKTNTGTGQVVFTYGNDSEGMRIDSSGNVGIGTSSPGGDASNRFVTAVGSTSSTFSPISGAVNSIYSSYATLGGLLGTTSNHALLFQTNNAERMRIDSSGNVLVGTTTVVNTGKVISGFNGSSAVGFVANDTASASSGVYFGCSLNGTFIGSIQRVGATSAVVYNTTSDQRLKSNVKDANPVLSALLNVKVRQYDWTDGDLHQEYGFVAQELESVLSDIVTKGKTEEDMWQLDYSRLTPHLVKAVQELSAKNDALEARLAALEAK